jgi:hypothetical protein
MKVNVWKGRVTFSTHVTFRRLVLIGICEVALPAEHSHFCSDIRDHLFNIFKENHFISNYAGLIESGFTNSLVHFL